MNKIFNWTFGACFRTIGRFFAIFLIGVLLIFIGSKMGLELPSWLSLKLNAATITYNRNWSASLPQLSRVDFKSCSGANTCNTLLASEQTTLSINDNNTLRTFNVNDEAMNIGPNGYIIETYANTRAGYLYEVNYYICSNKNIRSGTDVNIYATYWGDGINLGNTYNATYRTDLGTIPGDGNDNREWDYCSLFGGFVVPEQDYAWVALRIQKDSVLSSNYLSVISVEVNELGLYNGTIENIINSAITSGGLATAESVEEVNQAVEEVQQEIQQTQDTITNEDTTGAESSASGFFNDFETETFGLTSIITAPLNAINSLINSSCNNLILPLPFIDKNLTLPCMNTIYSNYFNGFFDLYQLITTGLISYYVIVRIFNLVKDFKNPEHDEIEVMDL